MVDNLNKMNKIKGQIKLDLINNYDRISIEIEVAAQEILIENRSITQEKKKILLKINEIFINCVKDILDSSCLQVDSFNLIEEIAIHDLDYLKREILKKSCYYINQKSLNHRYSRLGILGVLITCSWYLDQNEKNFLKSKFGVVKDNIKDHFELDENILLMIHGLNGNELDNQNFSHLYHLDIIKLRETFYSLKKLDMIGCSIKYINNNTFKILKNLIELNMSENSLKKLNQSMFLNLSQLKSLNLGMNLIKEISDDTFNSLTDLENLDLTENQIRNINSRTFNGLNKLKSLDISNNFLTETSLKNLLDSESLFNLEKLYLRNCNITKIDENEFLNLKNLKTLDLSQNRINHLKKVGFNGLGRLNFLDLSSCEIRRADQAALSCLSNLIDLHIIDNPIEQNMGLDKLKSYLLNSISLNIINKTKTA